jgi:hypothetical protein
MTHKDYEAIGRYHAALEEFEQARSECRTLALEAERELRRITDINSNQGSSVVILDHAALVIIADKLAAFNMQLMQAASTVNDLASQLGKPKLHIYKSKP